VALERALESTLKRGEPLLASIIQGFCSILEGHKGSPSVALAHAHQSVENAERGGAPVGLSNAYRALGRAYLVNEQLEEARAALEHALALAPGARAQNATALSNLAEACAGLGDTARAREAAAEAIAIAKREDVRLPFIPLSLARVLRSADGLAAERQIEAALESALQLVAETGARVFEPQVHEERAGLARLRGDEATRERELCEARRLYSEMGATGHVQRLSRELGS
jgi:tetratricopeptide (TPR) repeat protein